MAKKIKCPNKDCRENVEITIPPEMVIYPGEEIVCGTCGVAMPVIEK
jgi:hypothetical protein